MVRAEKRPRCERCGKEHSKKVSRIRSNYPFGRRQRARMALVHKNCGGKFS